MANSYGQFTLWASVSYVVKSEPTCTSHKPSAIYQRWLVRGELVHGICPHAATQSYTCCLFRIEAWLIDFNQSWLILGIISTHEYMQPGVNGTQIAR